MTEYITCDIPENPWIDVTLNEGHRADRFEILATKDLLRIGLFLDP